MKLCPHCKRPMDGATLEMVNALDAIDMPNKERLVVDALVSSYPRIITKSELEGWVYEDKGDAIPEVTSIHAHVSKARKKLKQHGWSIKGHRFLGYRLVRLDGAAS